MSQEVLAVVAGEEITQEEFNAFLQAVPREQQAYLSNPQFREQCLQQLISLRLYTKLGEEKKLEETEEFKKMMENARRDILAQMAMREVMKTVAVSEEELKAYYEENKKQYSKGDTVSAKHILTEDEDTCKAIQASIEKGEKTFEDAAKESSTCPSGAKGGDLGVFGRGQMVKEFEDAAFGAQIGQIVGPVKTQFGYHLIKVEQKNEATVAGFEEVKETIHRTLLQKKQHQAFDAKAKELREKYM